MGTHAPQAPPDTPAASSRPGWSSGTPGRIAVLVAGALLAASLFLPWSHQLPADTAARFARSPLLAGVPADPTGWQAYAAADFAYLALAALLLLAAAVGSRVMLSWALAASVLGAGFVVHALAVPPSSGVGALLHPSIGTPAYAPVTPTAGSGETMALIALGLALAGLSAALARSRSPQPPD